MDKPVIPFKSYIISHQCLPAAAPATNLPPNSLIPLFPLFQFANQWQFQIHCRLLPANAVSPTTLIPLFPSRYFLIASKVSLRFQLNLAMRIIFTRNIFIKSFHLFPEYVFLQNKHRFGYKK
jgi:hypothetical protein